MKCFFLVAWGEALMLAILLLWACQSSPTTPNFSKRLCARVMNSTSLFMAVIDSRVFQCRCILFCILIALVWVGMWARIVHSMPPLLGSSRQLHSRLMRSFNGSLYLKTLSSSSVSTRWISSSKVGLKDQSSSTFPVILIPIGRLGSAWFLEWISTSFWEFFSLVRTG